MRQCEVYNNGILAGVLQEITPTDYRFIYDDDYLKTSSPAISLTMPRSEKEYRSPHLFSFFANMLSEGYNRDMQARLLHIDKKDDFGILLETAQYDTIGAITVKPI